MVETDNLKQIYGDINFPEGLIRPGSETEGSIDPYILNTGEFRQFTDRIQAELFANVVSDGTGLFAGINLNDQTGNLKILEDIDIILRSQAREIEPEDSVEKVLIRTAILNIKARCEFAQICNESASIDGGLVITILQPMYHETQRLLPRDPSNPYGEDSLKTKLNDLMEMQIEAARQIPDNDIKFRVLVIDDNCDQDSGETAKKIKDEWLNDCKQNQIDNDLIPKVKVTFLEEEDADLAVDSKKGGSIIFGLQHAVKGWKMKHAKQIIVDSDADSSIPIIQVASLVKPIVLGETLATAGSRRMPESVSCSSTFRNDRSKDFRRLVLNLLPTLATFNPDINRGFKAFDSSIVPELVKKVQDHTFPYQIELLLILAKLGETGFVNVPIAFIDSEVFSNQKQEGDMVQSYPDQLMRVLNIGMRHKETPTTGLMNKLMNVLVGGEMNNGNSFVELADLLTYLNGLVRKDIN